MSKAGYLGSENRGLSPMLRRDDSAMRMMRIGYSS